MIEINQLVILAVLVILWGIFTLVRPKSSQRIWFGLLISYMGAGLLLAGVVSFFTPFSPTGEIFVGTGVVLLAGLTGVLLVTFPGFPATDLSPRISSQSLSETSFKNLREMFEFLKTVVNLTEEADFSKQILLLFFFLVIILSFKLT